MSRKEEITISDKKYVLDICDEILGLSSLRQYSFEFLFEDSGKKENRTKIAVDAFYEELNLVIQYTEREHIEKLSLIDKINNMAISVIYKGEERKVYDKRIDEDLPKKGFRILEISYLDFKYDSRKRIIRNKSKDKEILKEKLKV